MTTEVLRAIWERAAGDPLQAVGVPDLATRLRLTPAEIRSGLQALEVTGFVQYEGPTTAPSTVRLTVQGAAQGSGE